MCGISGIFAYHYASPDIDRKELHLMRDHMISRGPDGEGEWCADNGRVGLGHRRLAIIDLSDEASQPMLNEENQLVICFNGEIYNYQALRDRLKQKGYHFRTHSDTEVLLHLYAEMGEDMLHELRGMFAFALWDVKKQALLLVRDPYGIKPLYYSDDGWTLRFGSQVKALLATGKVSTEPEPAGIVGFYLFGSVPEPYTLYQDIHTVPAGSYLWIDSTGPEEPRQYFSISRIWSEVGTSAFEDKDVQAQVREALVDSVKHHMVSDVPVGAFLSAGIDSGVLVGLMSELNKGNEQLRTICIAFDELKGTHHDESLLAAEVAAHYGTQHTTRYVTEDEFRQDLPKIMDAMDQPTIDGINTWFVAKAAKEQGLKVAVSGLGGDELFGGYPSFRDLPRWVKQLWLPCHIPGLGSLAEKVLTVFTPLFPKINPKIAGMIRYGGNYSGAYLLKRGLFLPNELTQLLDPDLVKEGLRRLHLCRIIKQTIDPCPRNDFGIVAALESSLYMRNQLLRDTDWAGMAHSVEVRVPLADILLLSKLTDILAADSPISGKQMLANSPEKPLPDKIVNRVKSGFTVPIGRWQQSIQGFQQWRLKPVLMNNNCPWARRWAYTVIESQLR